MHTKEVVAHRLVYLDSRVVLGDRLACILLHANRVRGLPTIVQQEQRFEARSFLRMHVRQPVRLYNMFILISENFYYSKKLNRSFLKLNRSLSLTPTSERIHPDVHIMFKKS